MGRLRAILSRHGGLGVKERDRLMEQGYSLPAEFDRLQAPSSAYAPRQVVTYLCTREHLVTVPFAVEVEVPEVWECRCGQPATRVAPDEASSAAAE
jgi:RNA polymerase-binding protein